MPGRSFGFTLLEAVLVLLLLGLLAAAALPAFFRGPSGLEWRLARDGLLRDLAAARAFALGRGRTTALLVEEGAYLLDLGAGEPLRRPLPAGARLVFRSGGGAGRVLFGPDGGSSGAVLELAAGERRIVVRVEEDGGIVRE